MGMGGEIPSGQQAITIKQVKPISTGQIKRFRDWRIYKTLSKQNELGRTDVACGRTDVACNVSPDLPSELP